MIFCRDKDPLVYGIQAVMRHSDYMCMSFTVYLYVLQLEIHLSREQGRDPNYLFNPATVLCLNEAWMSRSNVVHERSLDVHV